MYKNKVEEKIMDIKLIGILIVIFVVIDLIYWFITKGGHKNGNKWGTKARKC